MPYRHPTRQARQHQLDAFGVLTVRRSKASPIAAAASAAIMRNFDDFLGRRHRMASADGKVEETAIFLDRLGGGGRCPAGFPGA